ncbi:hypothetical protein J5U23_01877 [Saccharolobus shibatae B12]|uniref:Uncharacterized protein n=1 Tax=Saccharolobus shibatae (strain ATCC 51178 / DSM 5389 / JCM 8931 / NBRC 15437 / B12) TaxID=523848 RepID=A0A8F5GTJ8_SACSH|nr:hypothetical protein J5U23_01877 [Saccharolobus shibatae B12]
MAFNYFFNHFSISSLYYDYVYIVLPQYYMLMSSLLMTGSAHEVLGVIKGGWEGNDVSLD